MTKLYKIVDTEGEVLFEDMAESPEQAKAVFWKTHFLREYPIDGGDDDERW